MTRRQENDIAAEKSLETRVSTPGEPRPMEEERISAIFELTDIKDLTPEDADRILGGIDLLKPSLMELITDVQQKVEAVMKTKAETPMTPEEMLDKINQDLANMGSTMKQRRLPKLLEGCEPLKGKTVVMVDDQQNILEFFVADLTVATGGKASFIQYKDQSMDELARQIMEHKPDVILMDYHLTEKFKGTSVVKTIKDAGFAGDIIGFSSDDRAIKEFKNVGAKGAVDKILGNALAEVAKLVAEQ